jgi:hypothetical protein
MKARCPLVPYQPAIVKQYWPMSVWRLAFSVPAGESYRGCTIKSPITMTGLKSDIGTDSDGEKDEPRTPDFTPNAER